MAEKPVTFTIEKKLGGTLARAGVIHTPHGNIHTPAFVVVGTKASVKSLMPEDMEQYVGNEVTLANTYHLFLQPGEQVIQDGGGLNKFAHWTTPTMTDSGGFQVFSLGAAFGKGDETRGERDDLHLAAGSAGFAHGEARRFHPARSTNSNRPLRITAMSTTHLRSHDTPVVEANEPRKSRRSVRRFLPSFSSATGVSHLLKP